MKKSAGETELDIQNRIKETKALEAKKKRNRRYRLHRKIKGIYRLLAREKIIFVTDQDEMNNKSLKELHEKYNYSIQFLYPRK